MDELAGLVAELRDATLAWNRDRGNRALGDRMNAASTDLALAFFAPKARPYDVPLDLDEKHYAMHDGWIRDDV